jgi:hypothetical protein
MLYVIGMAFLIAAWAIIEVDLVKPPPKSRRER